MAQNANKIDSALDSYDKICTELISLRESVRSGSEVSISRIQNLSAQIGRLREMLLDEDSQMTPAQKCRFMNIGRKYRGLPPLSEMLPAPYPAATLSSAAEPMCIPGIVPSCASPAPMGKEPQKNQYLVLATISPMPDLSFGVMGGCLRGKVGAYVSMRASSKRVKTDAEAYSDGTFADGSYLWTSGGVSKSMFCANAGILLMAEHRICLYAGAGYGSRSVSWKYEGGGWANISDLGHKGLSLEGGLVCHPFKGSNLALLAGGGTIAFATGYLLLGAGIVF